MPYATNNKLSTSPIEGGIEITPAEYADALADMQEGKRLSIEGGQMVLAFPAPPEPEPEPEPTPEELLAQAQANRRADYTQESDPLFFKWQRGTATEQEWLDKIEEIRVRYPYPGEE